MLRKTCTCLGFVMAVLTSVILSGCGMPYGDDIIVNRYADVLLTKKNELQFRFRINHEPLVKNQAYKVRVSFHDDRLAGAIGKREVIYGEDMVLNGEYFDVNGKEKYIYMDPIPLIKDLHIDELKTMIENDRSISIEVFNDKEVFGRAFLTNFSSEM